MDSSSTRLSLLVTVTLLAATTACKRTERTEAAASSPTEPSASATPAADPTRPIPVPLTTGEPETKLAPGELPTPANYEVEVQEKLVRANLELELDVLVREIGD